MQFPVVPTRSCGQLPEPDHHGGDADHRQEGLGGFVVARRDAAEVFDFVDKAFDEMAFLVEVGIIGLGLEKTLPHPPLRPAGKAPEGAVPVAELRRQVAPRRARGSHPQRCLHEQPVVPTRHPPAGDLARHQILDPMPLRLR